MIRRGRSSVQRRRRGILAVVIQLVLSTVVAAEIRRPTPAGQAASPTATATPGSTANDVAPTDTPTPGTTANDFPETRTATPTPVQVVIIDLGVHTISGVVYEAELGRHVPVAGARVSYTVWGTLHQSGSVISAADGSYEFEVHLHDRDTVNLIAEASRHRVDQRTFAGPDLALAIEQDFALLSSPPELHVVDITGRVYDTSQATDAPIAGAEVRYSVKSYPSVQPNHSGMVQTAADGTYLLRIDLYPYDIIEFFAAAPGFVTGTDKAKAFWLEPNFQVDFGLLPVGAPRGHYVSGLFRCPGGPTRTPSRPEPAGGYTITLDPTGRSTVSDHNASFRFHNVPSGAYTLRVSVDGPDQAQCPDVPLTVDNQDASVEICPDTCNWASETPGPPFSTPSSSTPSPTASGSHKICGIIGNDPFSCAGGIADVTIRLQPTGQARQSGEDGSFCFEGVEDGEYALAIFPQCRSASGQCWTTQTVYVDGEDVTVSVCPERCSYAVDVLPTEGPAGEEIEIRGWCYWLHSGRSAQVFFDEVVVGEVRGDTPGNYALRFQIPPGTAGGPHVLRVAYPSAQHAAGVFTVLDSDDGCTGDCNGDGAVAIEELSLAVKLSIGDRSPDTCTTLDGNGDGDVTVVDVLAAVARAMGGCPAE